MSSNFEHVSARLNRVEDQLEKSIDGQLEIEKRIQASLTRVENTVNLMATTVQTNLTTMNSLSERRFIAFKRQTWVMTGAVVALAVMLPFLNAIIQAFLTSH